MGVTAMSVLDKLEAQLDIWLDKKAPVKMPPNWRKALAGAMWWIALVVGVVQLFAVWGLWRLGHLVDQVVTYNNYVAATYGVATPAGVHLGLFYWISLFTIAADTVLLFLAAPKLKQMQKGGWNLVYYGAVLSAAYAVVRLFAGVGDVFGNFMSAAIGAVIGAFLLFQVRDYFTGAKAAHATPSAAHHEPGGHAEHHGQAAKK